MQEVLSKTDDPNIPLRDQEFCELCLYDSDCVGLPVFCIREARARWDEETGQIAWDERRVQMFTSRQDAKERYEACRLALTKEGFIYSDMEL
jgi:hypothetical protein